METYTVSLFGHRHLRSPHIVEPALETVVRTLLTEEDLYTEFLVGRDGDFDILAASVIRRLQKTIRHDNSALVWVLPYPTADFLRNEKEYRMYYDEIEICEEAAAAHYKASHRIRNRSVVDRSDAVVCWVDHPSGGAYTAICHARRQKTPVLSLVGTGVMYK